MSARPSRYAAASLVVCFGTSLAYEVWRSVSHAGESEWDAAGAWWVPFYGFGFLMAWLVARGRRRDWQIVWGGTVILWLVGAVGYNPVVLMDRNPGFIDHVESALYMGLLAFVTGVATERLWGRSAG